MQQQNISWAQLDTIRLGLASCVVAAHFVQVFVASGDVLGMVAFPLWGFAARAAVLGFFVISGLVIARSLAQKVAAAPEEMLLDFAARRIARIYPPLLISILLVLTLEAMLRIIGWDHYAGFAVAPAREAFDYNLRNALLSAVTFGFRGDLSGVTNGPLWSLALELQLYVVAALAFYVWNAPHLSQRAVAFAVLAALVKRMAAFDNYGVALCYGAFIVGMLLAIVLRFSRAHALLAFAVLSAIFSALIIVAPMHPITMLDSSAAWIEAQLAVIFGFAALVLALLRSRYAPLPILDTDFSYSLYICHFPVMLAFFFIFYRGNGVSLAGMIFCWIAAPMTAIALAYRIGRSLENKRYLAAIAGHVRRALSVDRSVFSVGR